MVHETRPPGTGFNETARDFPADSTVHALFEEQVARSPDAVAVVFDGTCLSYHELDRRANLAADRLRSLGVAPEALVGLCMFPSLDLVIGLLAILKAGGAYVPLDPDFPARRLAFITKDARLQVILTHDQARHRLPASTARVVVPGTDGETPSTRRMAPAQVGPTNAAYVIYTSGSTGRPKGVVVTHANVTRLFSATASWFGFDANDVWTLFHSLAFDFSVWELWGALIHGGRLVVVPRECRTSPPSIWRMLGNEGVTVFNQTPTAFRHLMLDDAAAAPYPSLRYVIFGGEVLDPRWLRKWFERHGDQSPRLVNMYGITETTVHVTYRPLSIADLEADAASPIGVPIPDLSVQLLDDQRRPVPDGEIGEIYVGGAGVARGYLNQPELTRERFIPESREGGGRLYRTGDRARRLAGGDLDFVGRTDDQVKIRGYRIELGEIESVLLRHPGVARAAVIARDREPGERRLAAYVVLGDGETTISDLRTFLGERLPGHMVPSVFVILDHLPLTPSGKTDRRALPAPPRSRPDLESRYVAPSSPTEARIAAIWCDLLDLDTVGVHDDFFDLGGHSLLATRMVARVGQDLGADLPVSMVFESPTVAATAEAVRSAEGVPAHELAPPIPPPPRPANIPLSHSQERVWFIQQLFPDNRAYHAQATLTFRGGLDVGALKSSLSEILRRHEIYRTSFELREGTPVQVVHDHDPVRLPLVDLSREPPEKRRAELDRRIEAEISTPVDPTRLPLVRWTLFRLDESEHVLLHVEHHLVHDGWGFNVLVRELQALYAAELEDRPSPLPEPPLQFADFALWQRSWMEGPEAQRQLAYWKEKLAGSPSEIALPFDRPRGAVQTFRGAAPRLELDPSLCASLRELSRQQGVTLFMTMLAAFATVLHRCSGDEDLSVGAGIANRRWPGTEGLMGMIINNLVLRLDLKGDPEFTELLRQVREVTLEAYGNQDVPFDWVVEAVRPERDPGRNPLFQTAFSFHDAPLPELEFPGLELEMFEAVSNHTAKFDLNVIVIPRSEQRVGLGGAGGESSTVIWEYNTDLFDAPTMEGLLRHYGTLLRAVVSDPHRRLSDLPLMTESERLRVLVEWNDTATDYPRDACIHELFSDQAESSPDAVAVVLGEERLTYRELDERSNRLANHLQGLGVGPEVPVGLCAGRSLEMIVATLGILKAGGAYVPLDPSFPKMRLELMADDTGMPVLLTEQRLLEDLPDTGAQVLCLDSQWETVAASPAEPPAAGANADSLAYVMYTSGSTGTPKGAEVLHRGVIRLVRDTDYVEIRPDDVFLQLAPISFDAATFEIWGALLNGATLVLYPGERYALNELSAVLKREQVTTLWLTAPLFHQMVDDQLEGLSGLRQLLAGGDVLSPTHVRRALEALPGCTLVNGYGPTEGTTFTCCHRMTADTAPEGTVPIGRPIANTRVYILDRHDRPVPPRVAGELVISGDGLARGYVNDPGLTAERFVPDPWSGRPGDRVYRTGDLARYRHDGTVEFLGRIDNQVKVRGFRVEPEEIETALRRHPAVDEVSVLAQEDGPGGKRLVAYLVAAEGDPPDPEELRSFLRRSLPDYMVPSSFVELEGLPLTASGKLDRRSLPGPAGASRSPAPAPPQTPTQETIAAIWCDVLSLETVGIHENFFDLGGHSLIATQVISRVLVALKVELPLAVLFSAPTIADLAEAVDNLSAPGDSPDDVPLSRQPRRPTPKS